MGAINENVSQTPRPLSKKSKYSKSHRSLIIDDSFDQQRKHSKSKTLLPSNNKRNKDVSSRVGSKTPIPGATTSPQSLKKGGKHSKSNSIARPVLNSSKSYGAGSLDTRPVAQSVSRPPKRINNNDGSYSIIFNSRPFGLTLDPLAPFDTSGSEKENANGNGNGNRNGKNNKLLKRKNSDKRRSMFGISRKKVSDSDKNNDKKDKKGNKNKDDHNGKPKTPKQNSTPRVDGDGCIVIGTNANVCDIVSIGSKVLTVNKENVATYRFQRILKLCATAKLPCIIKFRDIAVAGATPDYEHSLSESQSHSQSQSQSLSMVSQGDSRPHSGRNKNKKRTFTTRKYSKDDSSVQDDSKVLESLSGMPLIKKAEKAEKDKKWKLAIEV